jgi:hypothetical protein
MTYLLLAIFVLLQIGDGVSTYLTLRTGKAHESNPVVDWLIKKFTLVDGLVIAKTFTVFIMSLLVFATEHNIAVDIALIVVNILYLGVVVSNFLIYRKNK